MNNNQTTNMDDWLRAAHREAGFRNGLILDGNVKDMFFDSHDQQYLTLPELLVRSLRRDRTLGFTIAGVWDQADGLRFPDGSSARRFNDALSGNPRSNQVHGDGSSDYDVGDDAIGRTDSGGGVYHSPRELVPAVRRVLQSNTERPLFVLDWTHLLVSQPTHLSDEERHWIIQAAKMLVGPAIVPMDSDSIRTPSGLVILITADLSAVPLALYHNDARVRVMAIPKPSAQRRRAFFTRHADDLRSERPRQSTDSSDAQPSSDHDRIADTFTDLTDELTLVDLRQIIGLSKRTDAPLPPPRLMNLYRLGDQRSPWEEIDEERIRRAEELLKARVIGQDQAVRHAATMLVCAYMGISGLQHSAKRTKPKGILFMVGPTGVGKTELAKAIAELIFGDESSCIRFDMSEYDQEHNSQRLVGAPPGYVGFEQGGELTNAVRRRPFSVLLFDEVEKAHPRLFDKFLQILEDGRLTDGRGDTVYFSQSVIIFTSNIGSSSMPDVTSDPEVVRDHFRRCVENHFKNELKRPELLNRIGHSNIMPFDSIMDPEHRRRILDRKIEPLRADLRERFGVELRLSEELLARYLDAARSDQGGRGLVNALESDLHGPLGWYLFNHSQQLRRGRVLSGYLDDDAVQFELGEQ